MISQNKWNINGKVVGAEERNQSVMLLIKGCVSRSNLYNQNGTFNCVVSKEQASNMPVGNTVKLTGRMVFGRKNFLIAE